MSTQRWRARAAQLAYLLIAAVVGAAAVLAFKPAAPQLSTVDIGFAQDMRTHHEQAVTMADMLAPDDGPDIRALAEEIRFQQLDQIGQMTGWLQIANVAMISPKPMSWMSAMPGMAPPNQTMPGMASQQDLKDLQHSTGRANEIHFLQLMTRHHQGGVEMAAYAAAHTKLDAIRQTALEMVNQQTLEIQLMTVLLGQRGAAPLRFP
jgi:uncharacterized protein (DUF305 family)